MRRLGQRHAVIVVVAAALAAGACGSDSGAPGLPTVGAARTFELADFQPANPVEPGKPVTMSFSIDQPDGTPLTDYATGPGPHTGIHLITVNEDLTSIDHKHPPVGADGKVSEEITFPAPGRYRVVVDAYPATGQRNFQLFRLVDVDGTGPIKPFPSFKQTVVDKGFRITMKSKPNLKALEASFLDVSVTNPQGKPATFKPYFGALAHAIFFRAESVDYFHTHVCAPGATGCTSAIGGAQVTGTSSKPGALRVGVLLPVAGTWRLFLQTEADGTLLTAPFTLTVS